MKYHGLFLKTVFGTNIYFSIVLPKISAGITLGGWRRPFINAGVAFLFNMFLIFIFEIQVELGGGTWAAGLAMTLALAAIFIFIAFRLAAVLLIVTQPS